MSFLINDVSQILSLVVIILLQFTGPYITLNSEKSLSTSTRVESTKYLT